MTERDRLIELISGAMENPSINEEVIILANYLIENGVIVPPCPIGTKIYMLVTKRARLNLPPFTFIKESILTFYNLERVIEDFGKSVFLTREEAESALKERENNV